MTGSVFTFSILAGLAPLVSASITYFTLRGKKNTANSSMIFHVLLCFSVGLLFAVATLELIPESIEMSLNDIGGGDDTEHEHGIEEGDHDHDHGEDKAKHNMRIPMYGLAFGFVILILIESFFSSDSNGGGHSHSHLMTQDDDHDTSDHEDNDHHHHHSHDQEHKYKPVDDKDINHSIGSSTNNSNNNHNNNSNNSIENNNSNDSNNKIENNPLSPNLNISNEIEIDKNNSSSSSGNKKNRRKTSADTKDDINIVIGDDTTTTTATGDNNKPSSTSQSKISFTTFIALCIHSFVDGAVISSAFTSSASVGARVAIAIVVHKIPDGLVLSSIILSQKNIFSIGSSYNNPFYYFLIVSSMTPIGSFISGVLFGGLSMSSVSFVLGFGAGTFLYITSTALLPEILSSNVKKSTSLISIVCGYIVFIILDSLFHGAH